MSVELELKTNRNFDDVLWFSDSCGFEYYKYRKYHHFFMCRLYRIREAPTCPISYYKYAQI